MAGGFLGHGDVEDESLLPPPAQRTASSRPPGSARASSGALSIRAGPDADGTRDEAYARRRRTIGHPNQAEERSPTDFSATADQPSKRSSRSSLPRDGLPLRHRPRPVAAPDDFTLPLRAGLWQCLTALARRPSPSTPSRCRGKRSSVNCWMMEVYWARSCACLAHQPGLTAIRRRLPAPTAHARTSIVSTGLRGGPGTSRGRNQADSWLSSTPLLTELNPRSNLDPKTPFSARVFDVKDGGDRVPVRHAARYAAQSMRRAGQALMALVHPLREGTHGRSQHHRVD